MSKYLNSCLFNGEVTLKTFIRAKLLLKNLSRYGLSSKYRNSNATEEKGFYVEWRRPVTMKRSTWLNIEIRVNGTIEYYFRDDGNQTVFSYLAYSYRDMPEFIQQASLLFK